MAIFHLSVSLISRKAGRSSTAAAAYRAGARIVDTRTGEIHDYTKKRGVLGSWVVMPNDLWQPTRAELWNTVEQKNKRADAQVAREIVLALPAELSTDQRQRLALEFVQEVATKYQVAADVSIHEPDRGGDERNYHAHVLTTTNRIEGQGLGNKARELDPIAHNRGGKVGEAKEVDWLRQRWAEMQNQYLQQARVQARVDHRSNEDRGIDQEPTTHDGPRLTAIKRRTNRATRVAERRHEEWRRRQHERTAADLDHLAALGRVQRARQELQAARANVVPHIRPGARGEAQLDRRGPLSAMVAKPPQLDGRVTYCWREWRPGMPERPYWGKPALVDRGYRVSIVGRASQAKIDALVDLVQTKGWATVELFGSIEFQIQAAQALAAAGVPLTPGTDAEVQAAWQRIAPEDPARGRGPDGHFSP